MNSGFPLARSNDALSEFTERTNKLIDACRDTRHLPNRLRPRSTCLDETGFLIECSDQDENCGSHFVQEANESMDALGQFGSMQPHWFRKSADALAKPSRNMRSKRALG